MSSKSFIFINSHPIQYFAPLYKYLNNTEGITCAAVYCTTHGLAGEKDKQFGVPVKWDLPLLDGYNAVFLKNQSPKPSLQNFWGILNLGIISYLLKTPKSIIIVHGWNYATLWLSLIVGYWAGHIVCLRAETPLNQELLKPIWKRRIRRIVFNLLFKPTINFYLAIGKQNQQFYKYYGVPDKQLLTVPYAVDNERFRQSNLELQGQRVKIRTELGLDPNRRVLLFVGKYIDKKRPLDLLNAFADLAVADQGALIMVGEGELRGEMENFICEQGLQHVILTGFVNQSKIVEFYSIADALVLCSEQGETWGLVVNEALNFSLPVIVSDLAGCADDLVQPQINGWVYPCGDIQALTNCLEECLTLPTEEIVRMGQAGKTIVDQYSFKIIAQQLAKIPHTRSLQ